MVGDGVGENRCDRGDEPDGEVERGVGFGEVVSHRLESVFDRRCVAHDGAAGRRQAGSVRRTMEQFGSRGIFQSAEVL
jgi:hypothetical protein